MLLLAKSFPVSLEVSTFVISISQVKVLRLRGRKARAGETVRDPMALVLSMQELRLMAERLTVPILSLPFSYGGPRPPSLRPYFSGYLTARCGPNKLEAMPMSGNDTCHSTPLPSTRLLSTFWRAGMNAGLWGNRFYHGDDNIPEGESEAEAGSWPG